LIDDYQHETLPDFKSNFKSVISPCSSHRNKQMSFRLFHNPSPSVMVSSNRQNLFYKINKAPEPPKHVPLPRTVS
jgi:hypothetical protein